jgi:nucleotide-binding universal stress UspA family protein
MIEVRKILCPVDLSETSELALEYAVMLARWYSASLTTLEVIWLGVPPVSPERVSPVLTPEQVARFGQELREFAAEKVPQDVPLATMLRHGPVVHDIVQEARSLPADLIVMGTHGLGGFERFILGSVTEKVLRKAPCPVFTVPPHSARARQAPGPFQSILCPIDFSPTSLKALSYALSLAQESGKRLILLHVFDRPADRPMSPGLGPETSAERRRAEEAALRELHALVPDDVRQWCECQELTAIGRPYEEILKVAGARQADLIVMGVHGRGTVELALLGSVTSQVVRRAACPVLTVRP